MGPEDVGASCCSCHVGPRLIYSGFRALFPTPPRFSSSRFDSSVRFYCSRGGSRSSLSLFLGQRFRSGSEIVGEKRSEDGRGLLDLPHQGQNLAAQAEVLLQCRQELESRRPPEEALGAYSSCAAVYFRRASG